MPTENYRLMIKGLPGIPKGVSLYDPIGDSMIILKPEQAAGGSVQIDVPATDCPRLLMIHGLRGGLYRDASAGAG